MTSPWHRDVLHGHYRERFMRKDDIWQSDVSGIPSFELYRLIIYLPDAARSYDGIKVIPRSHMNRGRARAPYFVERPTEDQEPVNIMPAKGDAVLFDQRLLHASMPKQSGWRCAVQLSFGQ